MSRLAVDLQFYDRYLSVARTMELLSENEINVIIKLFGIIKSIKWQLEEFPDKVIGYLGDHLKLIIEGEKDGVISELKLFVKCMPRFDQWKYEYLKELKFFHKEFIMLSRLFQEFQNGEGSEKWRPKLLYIRDDLFVFEDVSQLGYKMPHHQSTMKFDSLRATVKTLARFHAQSYIYEERKSEELGKPYRIWDDFSEYLQEPDKGQPWRDAGRNAVIDYLKVFSQHKSNPEFIKRVEYVMPMLYDRALGLMKPSAEYRNVVVHRDLWTNNIFIKEGNYEPHALIIDFQTILYASPMLDLSSLIYFNTDLQSRDNFSNSLINIYYDTLTTILQETMIDIDNIFPRDNLMKAYNESLIFGLTQASIIVPIIAMNSKNREEIFYDPEKSVRANVVSRSEEFINIAKEDPVYQIRISELFDEIVETYIYPKVNLPEENKSYEVTEFKNI